jgi:hypothetical protein
VKKIWAVDSGQWAFFLEFLVGQVEKAESSSRENPAAHMFSASPLKEQTLQALLEGLGWDVGSRQDDESAKNSSWPAELTT